QPDDRSTATIKLRPQRPPGLPPQVYTEQRQRSLAGEIIREKVIRHTRQEMPHAPPLLMDQFEETETITRIHATIVVEKDSQKPIVIGAAGARIQQIGTEARLELEWLSPPKVYLELIVKVEPQCRDNRAAYAAVDYRGAA